MFIFIFIIELKSAYFVTDVFKTVQKYNILSLEMWTVQVEQSF